MVFHSFSNLKDSLVYMIKNSIPPAADDSSALTDDEDSSALNTLMNNLSIELSDHSPAAAAAEAAAPIPSVFTPVPTPTTKRTRTAFPSTPLPASRSSSPIKLSRTPSSASRPPSPVKPLQTPSVVPRVSSPVKLAASRSSSPAKGQRGSVTNPVEVVSSDDDSPGPVPTAPSRKGKEVFGKSSSGSTNLGEQQY